MANLLSLFFDRLAELNTGRSKEPGKLLEMQLNCICAQDFLLGKLEACRAYRSHLGLKRSNCILQKKSGRCHIKLPAVDATGHILEAAMYIVHQTSQFGFKVSCVVVAFAPLNCKFQCVEEILRGSSELMQ